MEALKRKMKILLSIMALGCFSFLGATVVHAETSGNVPVTYTRTESATYPLNVDVSGAGEVLVGKETLRNQEKQYLLPIDETMTFELKADEGAKVKSIKLNGKNLEGNKVIVKGAEKEQRLSISFVKNTSGMKLPHTGDTTKIGLSIFMLILAIVGASYMYYGSRKQKNIKS